MRVWGGEVIGLNSNIRVYRYGKGQFFDQHCEFLTTFMASMYGISNLTNVGFRR